MSSHWTSAAALLASLIAPSTVLANARDDLARRGCAALARAVTATPAGPVLLASYPVLPGIAPPDAALRNVAFVYDNALASIALTACGKPQSARRIADALARAASADPQFDDGRVRNAYAAGPVAEGTVQLAGFWSAERKLWIQDPYQLSTSTGNVAWAALALLDAHRHDHTGPYLAAARRALQWTRDHAVDNRAPAGFTGGTFLSASGPVRQTWKSTEHNVDLAAAWTALGKTCAEPDSAAQAAIASRFVASQWDGSAGRFYIGTGTDGLTSDRERSGLDAQIWPLIALAHIPDDWTRALRFVDAHHRIDGGYGYNRDPDGIWTEGTAQMAAVLVLRGQPERAAPLWPILARQATPDGWLYATPEARIRTGLAIGPDSASSDFFYYHLPHLGATAWAVIAAKGANPFLGTVANRPCP